MDRLMSQNNKIVFKMMFHTFTYSTVSEGLHLALKTMCMVISAC